MWNVLEIVVPVFAVISLGYGIRLKGLVDGEFFKQVNGLLFYICLPLLLFYKTGTADFSANFNLGLVVATSGAVGCGFSAAWLYGRWKRFKPPVQGAFCQGSFRGNLAYIGLAIVYNAYGDIGLTRAAVLLGFLVPVFNFFAILALTLPGQQQQRDYRKITLLIVGNPLIIGSLLGIGWSVLQLPMPVILERTLAISTDMTLPLALLSIGGSFSLTKLKGDIWITATAAAMKLILLPLLTAALMVLFSVSGLDFGVGLLMAGAPTAIATYIMAEQMGADGELAGAIVVMATGLSALSYTVLLLFLNPSVDNLGIMAFYKIALIC